MRNKILHISDLHLQSVTETNKVVYNAADILEFILNKHNIFDIDYIVITGDYSYSKNELSQIYEELYTILLLPLLHKTKAKTKIYLCLGNYDNKELLEQTIDNNRIIILNNDYFTTDTGLNVYVTHAPTQEYVDKQLETLYKTHFLHTINYKEHYKDLNIANSLADIQRDINTDNVIVLNGHLHISHPKGSHTENIPCELNCNACSFMLSEHETATTYINHKQEICEPTLNLNIYTHEQNSDTIDILSL